MLKILNRKRKQIDVLENPISPVIEESLGSIGKLTFGVPASYQHLELEGYVQVEGGEEYVIKEIVTQGHIREVVCMLNIEEIIGMAWATFTSRENDLMKTAELVLSGTRWRAINKSTSKVVRNLHGKATNSYNLLQLMSTIFDVEFIFDTYKKELVFVDKVGSDLGAFFMSDVNLKRLKSDTHTHKYITRLIPIGKDGLTIESVNGGKNYLEDKSYTDKTIYGLWMSDKHEKAQDLKDDAQRFLTDMATPYETYEVEVTDLAKFGDSNFNYIVGDIVTIIDAESETKLKQRIIQRTYNLLEPDKDIINIASKDISFEDYYKKLQTIADMTEAVLGSTGNNTIQGEGTLDNPIGGDMIKPDSIEGGHLKPDSIETEHIKADSILAGHIQANQIQANHINADSITADHIQSNSIDTRHLKADSITADHIQAGTIVSGSGIIADGAIGDAQISNLNASKLSAGTIDTSLITVADPNNNLTIRGNRLQVFEGLGIARKERVSLGDVNGDGSVYGLRVRGRDGETILMDENGVKSEGITNGSITNDKINSNANIDGTKLNINSVISSINTNNGNTIKGTKIEVDGTTLTGKFNEITTTQTEQGNTISEHYTKILANERGLATKVGNQVYTEDKAKNEKRLQLTESKIGQLEDSIELKASKSDITKATDPLNTRITTSEAQIRVNTDAIRNTVSKTSYDANNKKVSQQISSIDQKADSITSTVSDLSGKYTEIKQTVDSIDVSGKVSFSDLSTKGNTIIHGGNIKSDSLAVNQIMSNNADPILKLFNTGYGYCAIDATAYNEKGHGDSIRLKADRYNYIKINRGARLPDGSYAGGDINFYSSNYSEREIFTFRGNHNSATIATQPTTLYLTGDGEHGNMYITKKGGATGALVVTNHTVGEHIKNYGNQLFAPSTHNHNNLYIGIKDTYDDVDGQSTWRPASANAVRRAYELASNHTHPYANEYHDHDGTHLNPRNVVPDESNTRYCGNHNSNHWYVVATNYIRYNANAGGVYNLFATRSDISRSVLDFFSTYSTIHLNRDSATYSSEVNDLYNLVYETNTKGETFTDGGSLAHLQSMCLQELIHENESLSNQVSTLEERVAKLEKLIETMGGK